MKINENIFREYDIRGVVKTDFSDSLVEDLGKSFGTYIYKKGGKVFKHDVNPRRRKKPESHKDFMKRFEI